MRRAALALVLGVALGVPGAAAGQFFVSTDPKTELTDVTFATLRVSGMVTAEFHGDPGAGCAAMGVCGFSGAVIWDVAGPGQLLAIGLLRDSVQFEGGFAALGTGDPFSGSGPSTSAHVRRVATGAGPGGLCSDAAGHQDSALELPTQRGSSVRIDFSRATGGDPLRTRCAGPAAGDLIGLLPARQLTVRAIGRGHRSIDFAVEREFAIHGFAGTLRSNVVVRIGAARRLELHGEQASTSEPRGRTRRRRQLTVRYRIARVTGQVDADVAGLADVDLCGPLDACGLLGTVRLAPRAAGGVAITQANASPDRPANDLRQALGLSAGRPPPGIRTSGYGVWDDQGTVTSALARGGAPECTDSGPIAGGGAVGLRFTASGVRASYGDPGAEIDALRTRCPGPGETDVGRSRPLASATVPLSAFRGRTVTLRLTRGGAFSSDGYSGRTRPDVTVVLRRVRVDARVIGEQLPEEFRRMLRRFPALLHG